jgi:hypothetical protein
VFSAYVQDSYKVTPRLTLNYGLRWEDARPLTDNYPTLGQFNPVTGTSYIVTPGSPAYKAYNTAFAPRFGFAYQPFGNQKTVVRGGFGRYYNTLVNQAFLIMTYYYPVRNTQNFVSSAGNPLSLPNPFVGAAAGTGFVTGAVDQNYRAGDVTEWSLSVQRQLASSLVTEFSYLGTAGRHLADSTNLNQPSPNTLPAAQLPSILPYPSYSTITWITSGGNSSYNSFQAKLEKRFSAGLSFLATYTFSKSLDDIGNAGANAGTIPQNSHDLRGSARGPSAFDIPHRFVFSPVYELPFGHGRRFLADGVLSRIVGGFQLSGIVTAQSGPPLTAVMSGNFSNTNNNLLGTYDRPNVAAGCNPNSAAPHTLQKWFNTACFNPPAFGTFGNEGVGTIRAPNFVNFDLSLARNFSLPREKSLQFRVETFNTLNHPNFLAPGVVVNTGTFGTISAANAPRDIQLALKLLF